MARLASERLVGAHDCSAVRGSLSQLPLLPKLLCNQSCGNTQMDMLTLLLGDRDRAGSW
jgi:hypothetical protein